MTVAITATEHPVYPPRVVIALTGITPGDPIGVYRQVAGNRTLLRAGSSDSSPDTVFRVVDAELPFGVPVTYVAVVDGVEYTAGPTTHVLTGGKVALSDAITGLAAEVMIAAAGARGRPRDSYRARVGGRNVVVMRPLGDGVGTYDLFTDTTVAGQDLLTLLAGATEGIVQIRQPGGYDGIDAYLAVDDVDESRWSQDGSDPRRIWTIQFCEVDGWPASMAAAGFTYAQVNAYYAGLTYADANADFGSYLDAKVFDFS